MNGFGKSFVLTATAMAAVTIASPSPASAVADRLAIAACAAHHMTTDAVALPQSFPDNACSWTGTVIRHGAVGVVVPARGSVAAQSLSSTGEEELTVEHDGGRITVTTSLGDNAQAPRAVSAQAELPACSDSGGRTTPWKVSGGYRYYYNNSYVPSNITASAGTVVIAATNNVSVSYTDCAGLTRPRAPAPTYLGATTRFANVYTNYTCAASDGYSVTSWLANADTTRLAYTCTWYSSSHFVTESDAVMNRNVTWFTANPPTGCSNRYDLQGIMTHERGHTYGLDHPDAPPATDHHVHGNLTMNSILDACTTKYRTFGAGDLNGMVQKY